MNTKSMPYPFASKAAQYTTYSDAELHYARLDANKARIAMHGWNPIAEAWYTDDACTIAAEQKRRSQ